MWFPCYSGRGTVNFNPTVYLLVQSGVIFDGYQALLQNSRNFLLIIGNYCSMLDKKIPFSKITSKVVFVSFRIIKLII